MAWYFFLREPCSTFCELWFFPLTRVLWSLCPHHFRPLTRRPDYNHKAKSSHTAFISVNLFSERGIFLTLPFFLRCGWSSSLISSHSVAEEDGVRNCWVRTNDLSYLAAEMERLALCEECGEPYESLGFPAELIRGWHDFLWLSSSFSKQMRSNKRGAALKKLWRELVSVSKHLRGMATTDLTKGVVLFWKFIQLYCKEARDSRVELGLPFLFFFFFPFKHNLTKLCNIYA